MNKITFFCCLIFISVTGTCQSSFTGDLVFTLNKNDTIIDTSKIIIAPGYIEKEMIFSSFNYPFDRIIFAKDSSKVYYINNGLKRILWEDIQSSSRDAPQFQSTNKKKRIKGHRSDLFIEFKVEKWPSDEKLASYTEEWITKDFQVNYGDTYYPLLQVFGIYPKGVRLETRSMSVINGDTSKYLTIISDISKIKKQPAFVLPSGYTIDRYTKETVQKLMADHIKRTADWKKIIEKMKKERENRKGFQKSIL